MRTTKFKCSLFFKNFLKKPKTYPLFHLAYLASISFLTSSARSFAIFSSSSLSFNRPRILVFAPRPETSELSCKKIEKKTDQANKSVHEKKYLLEITWLLNFIQYSRYIVSLTVPRMHWLFPRWIVFPIVCMF